MASADPQTTESYDLATIVAKAMREVLAEIKQAENGPPDKHFKLRPFLAYICKDVCKISGLASVPQNLWDRLVVAIEVISQCIAEKVQLGNLKTMARSAVPTIVWDSRTMQLTLASAAISAGLQTLVDGDPTATTFAGSFFAGLSAAAILAERFPLRSSTASLEGSVRTIRRAIADLSIASIASEGYSPPSVFTEAQTLDGQTIIHDERDV